METTIEVAKKLFYCSTLNEVINKVKLTEDCSFVDTTNPLLHDNPENLDLIYINFKGTTITLVKSVTFIGDYYFVHE